MSRLRIEFIKQAIEVEKKDAVLVLGSLNGEVVCSCYANAWQDIHPMVYYVHTQPRHRRKGFASEMLKALSRYARRAGKGGITLTVAKKNRGAIALYRRCDFKSCYDDEKTLWMSIALNQ